MNILSGKFKGKKLARCKTSTIRPAMALVRKSIFDSLRDFIVNSSVLDLCAGTGILGLEALSRGAEKLTLIDSDKNSARLIIKNLELCNAKAKVILGNLPRILKKIRSEKYDLIFLDPPYGQGKFIQEVLEFIMANSLLTKNGIISIEHETKCEFVLPQALVTYKSKKFGNTTITFLQHT